MKDLGYGAGYQYARRADARVDQQDLPDSLRGRQYRPTDRGLEGEAGPPPRRMEKLARGAAAA